MCVYILYTFLILLRLKYLMLTQNYFFAIHKDFFEDLLVVQSPLLLMLQKRRRYALATVLFLERSWLCCSCIRGIP